MQSLLHSQGSPMRQHGLIESNPPPCSQFPTDTQTSMKVTCGNRKRRDAGMLTVMSEYVMCGFKTCHWTYTTDPRKFNTYCTQIHTWHFSSCRLCSMLATMCRITYTHIWHVHHRAVKNSCNKAVSLHFLTRKNYLNWELSSNLTSHVFFCLKREREKKD